MTTLAKKKKTTFTQQLGSCVACSGFIYSPSSYILSPNWNGQNFTFHYSYSLSGRKPPHRGGCFTSSAAEREAFFFLWEPCQWIIGMENGELVLMGSPLMMNKLEQRCCRDVTAQTHTCVLKWDIWNANRNLSRLKKPPSGVWSLPQLALRYTEQLTLPRREKWSSEANSTFFKAQQSPANLPGRQRWREQTEKQKERETDESEGNEKVNRPTVTGTADLWIPTLPDSQWMND